VEAEQSKLPKDRCVDTLQRKPDTCAKPISSKGDYEDFSKNQDDNLAGHAENWRNEPEPCRQDIVADCVPGTPVRSEETGGVISGDGLARESSAAPIGDIFQTCSVQALETSICQFSDELSLNSADHLAKTGRGLQKALSQQGGSGMSDVVKDAECLDVVGVPGYNGSSSPLKRRRSSHSTIQYGVTSNCSGNQDLRTRDVEVGSMPFSSSHGQKAVPRNLKPPSGIRSPHGGFTYQEWPLSGFLKRVMIGEDVTFSLQFTLDDGNHLLSSPLNDEDSKHGVADNKAELSKGKRRKSSETVQTKTQQVTRKRRSNRNSCTTAHVDANPNPQHHRNGTTRTREVKLPKRYR
jgi:hypothetical protein